MCGIAGVETKVEVESPGALGRLLASIIHRGPDDVGTWSGDGWAIGMRRLAIIDLSGGHQPMVSANGRWVLVLNGEIYNHHELRRALEAGGQHFRTSSDTEVLLETIAAFGVAAALAKVEGMFAFAAVDRRSADLWLARDRFGEKPLFLDRRNGGFAFCSELAPLLLARGAERQVDWRGLGSILRFGHPWPGSTAVSGIGELRPAEWLHRTAAGAETFGKYWSPPDRVDEQAGTLEHCGQRLLEQLDSSVRDRLVADVPVGLFLSGGIDSGAVAASAVRARQDLQAVTVGFDDGGYDETPLAQATATRLGIGIQVERQSIEPFAPAQFDELLLHHGQPFADTSAVPTRAVSRAARKHFKVVLSGDGGDELLAGYMGHARNLKIARWFGGPLAQAVARAGAKLLPGEGDAERYRRALDLVASARDGLLPHVMAGVFDDEMLLQLFEGSEHEAVVRQHLEEAALESARIWRSAPDKNLALSLYQLAHSMPQDILTKVDRMSMAESLEVRAPFLDSRLANYALSLPSHLKLDKGLGKYVLRHALRDRLPASVLAAPKRGFAMPVRSWLGELFWSELEAETAAFLRDGAEGLNADAFQRRVKADRELCRRGNHYRALHRAVLLYGFLRWRSGLMRGQGKPGGGPGSGR
jgi:asparagine synthase (glutamine-hydrolysing)